MTKCSGNLETMITNTVCYSIIHLYPLQKLGLCDVLNTYRNYVQVANTTLVRLVFGRTHLPAVPRPAGLGRIYQCWVSKTHLPTLVRLVFSRTHLTTVPRPAGLGMLYRCWVCKTHLPTLVRLVSGRTCLPTVPRPASLGRIYQCWVGKTHLPTL